MLFTAIRFVVAQGYRDRVNRNCLPFAHACERFGKTNMYGRPLAASKQGCEMVRKMPTPPNTLDDEIAHWLRTGHPGDGIRRAPAQELLLRIDLNGVAPLLVATPGIAEMPDALQHALEARRIGREMWEAQHRRIVSEAIDSLVQAGLQPLVMKGTALAYSHYTDSAARVRGDSDLIVEETGRASAFASLEQAGFRRDRGAGGVVRVAARLFQKPDLAGKLHDIDLHWRLNSSRVLAGLFDHGELLARSVPLPELGPDARGFGAVDELIFTAVHRVKHVEGATSYYINGEAHATPDSLIWLMDIHLLFRDMSDAERITLCERAAQKGVSGILAGALIRSKMRLGTEVPEDILETLDSAAPSDIARYLKAPPVRQVLMDMASMDEIGSKLQFVRETLFPSREFMRTRFPEARLRWLPWLYLRRLVGRFGQLLRREGPAR